MGSQTIGKMRIAPGNSYCLCKKPESACVLTPQAHIAVKRIHNAPQILVESRLLNFAKGSWKSLRIENFLYLGKECVHHIWFLNELYLSGA